MSRPSPGKFKVYLEVGNRRTFAAALEWPGWCRSGRDEAAALQALFAYGPRYARVLRPARLGFQAPKPAAALVVAERLTGNATTDFGAPDLAPAGDGEPVDDADLRRLQAVLAACWRAWDAVVQRAAGQPLRTGPRGGGRGLDGLNEHVLGAEQSYLSALGGRLTLPKGAALSAGPLRQAILETLTAAARGEIAERGPRGGKRWSPRYFVRRAAWHILDHVWEIEDRLPAPAE